MRNVILGQGLDVSVQGLGCMGMSAYYGPTDETEAIRTLEHASELGVTMFDTADVYADGLNEKLLRRFLQADSRGKIVIATKFGLLVEDGTLKIRGDPAYVVKACESSLERLGVDQIDLYYYHRPDEKTPMAETVRAMAGLIDAGRVKHLGLSNVTGSQLREGNSVYPITAVQVEWSLFTRDCERNLLQACAELGVGVVAYSPLGRGFLTGRYTSGSVLTPDDSRLSLPRFQGSNAINNAKLLEPIRKIAQARGITLGQVALAWVHNQTKVWGVPVVPIPGTKHSDRLEENLAAAEIELNPAEMALLDNIGAQVSGGLWA
jgi:aryl-alcohol dehydrogenase-like predicted oxidoreductase